MLRRLGLTVVVAVVVTLGCMLLGVILTSLEVTVALKVGDFLEKYSAVFGVLAGIWYFFQGHLKL